jgi:hypothetical protein
MTDSGRQLFRRIGLDLLVLLFTYGVAVTVPAILVNRLGWLPGLAIGVPIVAVAWIALSAWERRASGRKID